MFNDTLKISRPFDKIFFSRIAVEFHINGLSFLLRIMIHTFAILSYIDLSRLTHISLLKSQSLNIRKVSAPDFFRTVYLLFKLHNSQRGEKILFKSCQLDIEKFERISQYWSASLWCFTLSTVSAVRTNE